MSFASTRKMPHTLQVRVELQLAATPIAHASDYDDGQQAFFRAPAKWPQASIRAVSSATEFLGDKAAYVIYHRSNDFIAASAACIFRCTFALRRI